MPCHVPTVLVSRCRSLARNEYNAFKNRVENWIFLIVFSQGKQLYILDIVSVDRSQQFPSSFGDIYLVNIAGVST